MPAIDEKTLKAQIKNREFSPVYVLFGTEAYLVLKYRDAIISSAVTMMPDMNCVTFDGTKADMADIIEACNQLPAFNDYRCVILNDFFPSKTDDKSVNSLLDYIKDPNSSTVLVLVYSSDHPAINGKFKQITELSSTLKLDRMDEGDLVRYITAFAGKRNCTMQAAAARYLIMCCGNDLLNLNNEMEKLCAYRPGLEITEDHIDKLCPKSLESNAFEITKNISSGKTGAALKILSDLIVQKEEPTQIMGAIAYSYISMYRCFAADVSGMRINDAAAKLKIKNSYALSRYQPQAKKLGEKNIIRCLKALNECDRMLKSSTSDDQLILEQTIVTLCAISGAR